MYSIMDSDEAYTEIFKEFRLYFHRSWEKPNIN